MIALGQTDIFRTGTNPQTELQMTLGNHQGYCGSSRSNRGVSDMSGSHCDNVSSRSLPVKSIQTSFNEGHETLYEVAVFPLAVCRWLSRDWIT